MDDVIARRSFGWEDQELFGALTGDVNPMHMDEQAARRTQAGAPVVHGIHILCWALDATLASAEERAVSSVQCKFLKFVFVDQQVALRVVQRDAGTLKLSVDAGGVSCALITMRFGATTVSADGDWSDVEVIAVGDAAIVQDVPKLDGLKGWITGKDMSRRFADVFPALAEASSAKTVEAIALTSTLVGMVSPGLHSIYSEISLALLPAAASHGAARRVGLGFRVDPIDERFQIVPMRIVGPGFTGKVSAFLRAAPVAPPTIERALQFVRPDAYAGQNGLIVGGSRGLGAATAMLLAAGGASVTVTFHRGCEEAEALSASINAATVPNRCRALAYDVTGDPAAQLTDTAPPSHLYYFATPKIFRQGGDLFSARTFAEFVDVYVNGFYALFNQVHRRGVPLSVMYPSSVAVEERPKGMTEYAMAKSAGEQLCRDLLRQSPKVRILTPRLPRILTDQTATVPPVPAAEAISTMAPLLEACA